LEVVVRLKTEAVVDFVFIFGRGRKERLLSQLATVRSNHNEGVFGSTGGLGLGMSAGFLNRKAGFGGLFESVEGP
jgi:hypothetical protein